jgi:phosphoglycerol transferase
MISAILVAVARLQLWRADLAVPFRYSGDAVAKAANVKGILDHGWFIENPCLGMPTGMKLYDYPVFATLTALFVKLFSLVLNNYAVVLNLYFVLTFPIIAGVSVLVFRRLGLSYPSSAVGGALYSLLPYHFLHGTSDLGLSGYYVVPLGILLAYKMWDVGLRPHSARGKPCRTSHSRVYARAFSIVSIIIIIVIVALSHLYYVAFSLFGLLVSGLSASLSRRRLKPAAIALFVAAGIAAITLLANLSSLTYQRHHGPNPAPTSRYPGESLTYGLELVGLCVPQAGYGIPAVDELRQKHVTAHHGKGRQAPFAYIGAIGVIGLIALLFELLNDRLSHRRDHRLHRLAVLNISLLLLATVGGFGYLFSLVVTPEIRVYNRVGVYIAFLSFAAFFILLDAVYERLRGRRLCWILGVALFAGIFTFGARDQTTETWKPEYDKLARQYSIDGVFVSQLERRLPRHAMILQLPYVSFLTTELPHDVQQEDHLRLYLHSSSLRWSYGAVVGRPADQWLRQTTAQETEAMLERVCLLGFAGVLVDRLGYADAGEGEIARLQSLLDQPGLDSRDGRYSFFELTDYCSALRKSYERREWDLREAREHLLLKWRRGFQNLQWSTNTCWCSQHAELWVSNISSRPIEGVFTIGLQTRRGASFPVTIDGPLLQADVSLSSVQALHKSRVGIPPGDHMVRFRAHGPGRSRDSSHRPGMFQAIEPQVSDVRWAE